MDNMQGWQRYGEKGAQGIFRTCVVSKQPLEEECTKGPGKEVVGKDLLFFINLTFAFHSVPQQREYQGGSS